MRLPLAGQGPTELCGRGLAGFALGCAKESEPASIPIDRLCLELVQRLKPGDKRLRTHQTLRQLLVRYEVGAPAALRRRHAEGSRIDVLAPDRTSRSEILECSLLHHEKSRANFAVRQ